MIQFSTRFQEPEGSPIRALYPYLINPEVVAFAGGNPAPDAFDVEGLREAMSEAMKRPATSWAQYSATEGVAPIREALAAHMSGKDGDVDPARILITASSQQGFDLLTRVLLNPGDGVVVERPTYPTALQALRVAGAEVIGMDSDAEGLDTVALEALLETRKSGAPIKAVYVVPTFANPSGATLSLARRKHLIELAVRYGFVVIEDDPYGELRFEGTPLPRIVDLARHMSGGEDHVVYLSSLSKVMAPGLRLGWMVASSAILRRCVIAKQSVDLCSSTWTQAAAAVYIAQGRLTGHIARASEIYATRAKTMANALRARLGDQFSFGEPQGGMFIWGRFAVGIDANQLLTQAIEAGVVYVPGAPFYVDRPDPRSVRLCFTMCTPERIEEGVKRLASAVDRHLSLPVDQRKGHL